MEKITVQGAVKPPSASRSWHPVARDWYRSLADSAQSQTFEPSDWQAARLAAIEMSRMLEADFPSPSMFKAIWSAMDGLLTTEGARRRVKLEAERTQVTKGLPDGVVDIDDIRRRLSG